MSSLEPGETVRAILGTLLDRYEQPGRQNVVRVRLSSRDHPGYFSAEDSAPRRETNDVLRRLAQAGMLRLHWRKWEEGNWLEAVDLVGERAASLYKLLGRNSRGQQYLALRQLLDAEEPRAGWHASLLAWARAQLEAHRGVAPLNRDDPHLNADLLRALAALADLRAPTLERALSVRLFGDSKRLEALRGAVVRVLRRHDPEAATFGDDEWALLRAHNLDRTPEYIPIAGPLALRVRQEDERRTTNGERHSLAGTFRTSVAERPSSFAGVPSSAIDLKPFQPSVALSAAMLRDADVVACDARALVTVENATSFSELLAARPAELLAVYTGGFASPSLIRLLCAIRTARPDLPLLHWGDLDAGGLRILAHLREHVGDVAPLAMSPAIFDAYHAFAQPLTPTDQTTLTALREHVALADCVSLIDTMLADGKKLEQEAVDIVAVLRQISSTARYHRNHCK
ncbi:MAG TPA: Wadjet anti-phage system protein JetD domain-containing protein [Roseiflexaceae bacterium]|nr:Wadjet anti-phage system protein JetD domain-containing protein [Roseiflexaceae bacterium]